MALDAGGNYVDENSDYSFQCNLCYYWFHDIEIQGTLYNDMYTCLECHEEEMELNKSLN